MEAVGVPTADDMASERAQIQDVRPDDDLNHSIPAFSMDFDASAAAWSVNKVLDVESHNWSYRRQVGDDVYVFSTETKLWTKARIVRVISSELVRVSVEGTITEVQNTDELLRCWSTTSLVPSTETDGKYSDRAYVAKRPPSVRNTARLTAGLSGLEVCPPSFFFLSPTDCCPPTPITHMCRFHCRKITSPS